MVKNDHEKAGFRMVPNSPVRKGSFVKNAVLMPCYVNIGAYIDEGTMIDTLLGRQLLSNRKNCHISAGSGVGGVLEPAQALPTIIEDNVFLEQCLKLLRSDCWGRFCFKYGNVYRPIN